MVKRKNETVQEIDIIVYGGLVQQVQIPEALKDITVRIKDYDVDGGDESLEVDDNGTRCVIQEYQSTQ